MKLSDLKKEYKELDKKRMETESPELYQLKNEYKSLDRQRRAAEDRAGFYLCNSYKFDSCPLTRAGQGVLAHRYALESLEIKEKMDEVYRKIKELNEEKE